MNAVGFKCPNCGCEDCCQPGKAYGRGNTRFSSSGDVYDDLEDVSLSPDAQNEYHCDECNTVVVIGE